MAKGGGSVGDALVEDIADEIAASYTEAGMDMIAESAGNPGQDAYFNDDLVPTFAEIAPEMMMQERDDPPDQGDFTGEMKNSCPDASAATGADEVISSAFEYVLEAWEIINQMRDAAEAVSALFGL